MPSFADNVTDRGSWEVRSEHQYITIHRTSFTARATTMVVSRLMFTTTTASTSTEAASPTRVGMGAQAMVELVTFNPFILFEIVQYSE